RVLPPYSFLRVKWRYKARKGSRPHAGVSTFDGSASRREYPGLAWPEVGLPGWRSNSGAPGVVLVLLAPLGEEVAQLVVDGLGQHDAHGYELVAGVASGGVVHAATLEAEDAARAGGLRQGHLHPAADGWHLDLGAQRGLVDGDGHVDDDVILDAL